MPRASTKSRVGRSVFDIRIFASAACIADNEPPCVKHAGRGEHFPLTESPEQFTNSRLVDRLLYSTRRIYERNKVFFLRNRSRSGRRGLNGAAFGGQDSQAACRDCSGGPELCDAGGC